MKASLYALQRQLGIVPGGPVEQPQDPAMQEFIEGVTALVQAVIAKKAAPAAPKPLRVQALLREIEAHAAALAPYQAPLPPRQSNALPIESKVVERTETGQIKKVVTTTAAGHVCTSTAYRDSLGRMIRVEHEMDDGRRATAKIRRDSMGRIAAMSVDEAPYNTSHASDDSNDSTIRMLVRVVEDAFPADPAEAASYAPGRNPLPRAYVQRDASGEIYAVNIVNQQLRPDQIHLRPSNAVVVQVDHEGRPFVRIRGWKMVITHDFSGQVQALEPMDED